MIDRILLQASLIQDSTKVLTNNSEPIDLNLISIILGVVGVIGTIFTIVSFIKTKKEKDTYKFLFNIAEQNIDKNITDKELSKKKEEVKKYSDKIQKLQENIEKEIPLQARVAVLKDKYYTQSEQLVELFISIKSIEKELQLNSNLSKIPKEFIKEIEEEISPSYLLKEKQSKAKNYISIITTITAILSAIIPYDRWITLPLLLLTIPFIVQLLRINININKGVYIINTYKYLRFLFWGLGIIGLVIFISMWIDWSLNSDYMVIEILITMIVLTIVFIFLGFMTNNKFKKLKSRIKK